MDASLEEQGVHARESEMDVRMMKKKRKRPERRDFYKTHGGRGCPGNEMTRRVC